MRAPERRRDGTFLAALSLVEHEQTRIEEGSERRMSRRQRIVPVRRAYNQWVANQTLEDFALRFTAKSARRFSTWLVAHTALGAVSFLAMEAIGAAITLRYGFSNAAAAICVVGILIFATGLPIVWHAARYGVDIDLLTRGAGFGYIGSTMTSLIYAGFTFIFLAIEAAIMAQALEMVLGLPLALGYVVSALVVIPLVIYGIRAISRFQIWTQPLWIGLHLLPFICIAFQEPAAFKAWTGYTGSQGAPDGGFDLLLFGAAASVVFALIAQIGEQVDFLRFLPPPGDRRGNIGWWAALLATGAGWIIPGTFKLLAGSFLAVLALSHGVPIVHAEEPPQMYRVAFGYLAEPQVALALMGVFVVISQLKINVTNAYAGSIAWSNFFSRLTHSHPGRVVWLVFNVAIALLLMEMGVYKALERTLGLYAIVAVAWVGALTADLVVNKPLGLSPPGIEFKRGHLYDINPVGIGAMLLATLLAGLALAGLFGAMLQALAPFVALAVAFAAAPAIAWATGGRFYLARRPRSHLRLGTGPCRVCENSFESEDMAHCPVYAGSICSLCCSLDARCGDACKKHGRLDRQVGAALRAILPASLARGVNSRIGHFLGAFMLIAGGIALVLGFVRLQADAATPGSGAAIDGALLGVFLVLLIASGIAAWLSVLAAESRRFAQNETKRQTDLLMREIAAHEITDAKLQRAKEVAEAANLAKSRYVVGISHELRTPLNAVLGYAQLLEADQTISPPRRQGGIRMIRRSAEHLSGLIDGLLDISKIEAGHLQLQFGEVRLADFLESIVDMFRMQAEAKGLTFRFEQATGLPKTVRTDEKRLRQILINLLTNAVKFTAEGRVLLSVSYRNSIAEFIVSDTGPGISQEDQERVFEPFERGAHQATEAVPGTGLGLAITKLLAEILGGDIRLESQPGTGTRFRVRLMLPSVAKLEDEFSPEHLIRGYEGRRRTIVVVDDDAAHRDLMREILVPLGFVLLTAPDGPTCLSLCKGCEPDLFLIDISMPGMSGWDLALRLRRAGHVEPAIIMMSANLTERGPAAHESDAHDGTLPKPFDLRRFLDEVRNRLQLVWLTDTTHRTPVARRAEGGVGLSPNAIEELRRLAEIGYVRGLEAKLTEIIAALPDHNRTIEDLHDHVRNFDLRGFVAALDRLSPRIPENHV